MKTKLYLDAETMGLNDVYVKDGKEFIGAKEYKMIEVGLILTDMHENIIDVMDAQIKINSSDIEKADPWSVEHHTKSGLLDKCLAAQGDTEIVEKKILDFLEKNNIDERVLLSGQSAHFDKEFIKYQMPKLFSKMNHQTFDISTLRHHYQDKYPAVMEALDEIKKEVYDHTALNDIAFSVIAGRVYDGMGDGDFTRGSELEHEDISSLQYIKSSVFDKVNRYKASKNNDKSHEIQISNFKRENKLVQVSWEDPDYWGDDVATGYQVSFDIKLDVQTVAKVEALYQRSKDIDGCDIKISFLKTASKDDLAEYIENKDSKFGFMSDFRKQEIINFCALISEQIEGDKKPSNDDVININSYLSEEPLKSKSEKLLVSEVPDVLRSYLLGNALEHRKETYVPSHRNSSRDMEMG